MAKRRLYAAYGSNLNLQQMALRCPTAKPIGVGVVPNYELQFKGQPYGAFATIGQKEGAAVPVAVWKLTEDDEKALDRYEGVKGGHYDKRFITVDMDGKPITALVYILNQRAAFGMPTQWYYDTVREGYEDFDLDASALNVAFLTSAEECRKIEAGRNTFQTRFSFFDEWQEESGDEPECEDEPELDGYEPDYDDQMHG